MLALGRACPWIVFTWALHMAWETIIHEYLMSLHDPGPLNKDNNSQFRTVFIKRYSRRWWSLETSPSLEIGGVVNIKFVLLLPRRLAYVPEYREGQSLVPGRRIGISPAALYKIRIPEFGDLCPTVYPTVHAGTIWPLLCHPAGWDWDLGSSSRMLLWLRLLLWVTVFAFNPDASCFLYVPMCVCVSDNIHNIIYMHMDISISVHTYILWQSKSFACK